MPLNKTKAIGLTLLATGLVGLGLSSAAMFDRLGHRDIPVVHFQKPVSEPAFIYRGDRVAIERVDADKTSGDVPALRLTYRGSSFDFPIEGHEDTRLPGLVGYDDWFRVVPMITGAANLDDAIEIAERGENRMIAAARYHAEGYDPESWGLVRRRDWRYVLVELNAAPAPEPLTVVRKSYRELDAIHTPGPYTPNEMIPTPEERERDLWQHYAMQQVTPAQFFRAKDRTLDSALSAMDWTWPAAGISVLLVVVGAGITAGSTVSSRRDRLAAAPLVTG